MIYFAQEKLGIYLNSFDWADGNNVLINMLHPIQSLILKHPVIMHFS